jgi:hypothetical protein
MRLMGGRRDPLLNQPDGSNVPVVSCLQSSFNSRSKTNQLFEKLLMSSYSISAQSHQLYVNCSISKTDESISGGFLFFILSSEHFKTGQAIESNPC